MGPGRWGAFAAIAFGAFVACSSSSSSMFENGTTDAGANAKPSPPAQNAVPPVCPNDVTIDGTDPASTVGLGDAGSCVAMTKGDQCVLTPPPCGSPMPKKYVCTCDGSRWTCSEDDEIGIVPSDDPCFDAGSLGHDAATVDAADASDD